MFTKEIINELFTERNGQNFAIKTNEGNGRGINGVTFSTYHGRKDWEDRNSGKKCFEESAIIKVADSYMVLRYSTNDGYLSGTREVVIPYDSITSIQFLTGIKFYFPDKIEKSRLFTVKKKAKSE